MIDDNLIYSNKMNCTFLLYKRPWNTGRPFEEYSKRTLIVTSWKDIEDLLLRSGIIKENITGQNSLTEATLKLIDGIKKSKDDKECIELLNPYIKMWQQQGILIGMKQINDATMLVTQDIIKELNEKK